MMIREECKMSEFHDTTRHGNSHCKTTMNRAETLYKHQRNILKFKAQYTRKNFTMNIHYHHCYWKDVKRRLSVLHRQATMKVAMSSIARMTNTFQRNIQWSPPLYTVNRNSSLFSQGKLETLRLLTCTTNVSCNALRSPPDHEPSSQSHHHFFFIGNRTTSSIFKNFARTAFSTQAVPSSSEDTPTLNQNLIPFLLADIGEGIKEVEILQWFVQPGQTVQQFDLICQVQSDKATVDITSRYDGVIASLGGATSTNDDDDAPPIIQVGQPLLYFYPNETIVETVHHSSNTRTSASTEVNGHFDGSISTSSSRIHDRPSDLLRTSANETVAPIPLSETQRLIENQQDSHMGPIHNADERNDSRSSINPTSTSTSMAQASPAVRRIAREYGISNAVFHAMIQGTGPNQRILKSDILSYVEKNKHRSSRNSNVLSKNNDDSDSTDTTEIITQKELTDADTKDKVITLRGYTRHMISTMTTSLQIPHMCFGDEIIMNNIMTMRQQINDSLSQPGIDDNGGGDTSPRKTKISVLALLIKAVSCAMLDYPILNSIQMMENDTSKSVADGTILQKQNHNFGIAIDTMSRGLVVPVIHQCQTKSVLTIQNDIDHFKQLAYNNQLQKEHFADLTFTISNVGSIGSGMFLQPVIVPPTLAMGAFGYTKTVPRFRSTASSSQQKEGSIGPTVSAVSDTSTTIRDIYEAQVMNVTWAGDHRFLDGATIGRFHNRFRYYVEEQPMMLLLK